MKTLIRCASIALLFLLGYSLSFGQTCNNHTLTATITDSDAQTWNNASFAVTIFNPSGGQRPVCRGTGIPITTSFSGSLSGAGVLSISLPDTSAVDPIGVQWVFTIQPLASVAPSLMNPVTLTANTDYSISFSSQVTVPRFTANPGSFGYNVTEANPHPCRPGNQWQNVSTNQVLFCSASGGSYIPGACSPATTGTLGCVKPDGTSITITAGGTISAVTSPATTVNGLSPTVVIDNGTDPHISIQTVGPSSIHVTPVLLDKLDIPNTHTAGNQLHLTGGASNPAIVIQGFGTNTANVVNSGNTVSSQVVTPTVSVGQFFVVMAYSNGGCCSASPVSTLGNTFTELNGADSCNGGICVGIWSSKISVAGSDSINTHTNNTPWILLSGINLTTPFDPTTSAVFSLGTVAAPGPMTFTVNQGGANDLIVNFANIFSGTLTPSNCVLSLGTGFANITNFVGDGTRTVRAQDLTSVTLGNTTYSIPTTCNAGSGSMVGVTLALQISGTFTQSACMEPIKDNNSNVLSCDADAIGATEPPQSAGSPAFTPGLFGAHVYDTTAHCDKYYDQVTGWTCVPTTSSVAPVRTTATVSPSSGSYIVTQVLISGTLTSYYDEDIDTGALTNGATTTVNLLHALPTHFDSCVCTDNSGRVQTGNTQALGCNVAGQSAPFSTFQIWVGATGENGFCHVRGY